MQANYSRSTQSSIIVLSELSLLMLEKSGNHLSQRFLKEPTRFSDLLEYNSISLILQLLKSFVHLLIMSISRRMNQDHMKTYTKETTVKASTSQKRHIRENKVRLVKPMNQFSMNTDKHSSQANKAQKSLTITTRAVTFIKQKQQVNLKLSLILKTAFHPCLT